MTVAAFMVAAASYAATTPTNAGVEVTVAKGAATGDVTLTLQKGTYEIKSSKGTVAVDDAVLTGTLVVDAKKDYKITVTLPAPAAEEDKVTLAVTPTSSDWKTWLEEQQNTINALTTEASALGRINDEDLKWRTDYLEQISALQSKKNKFGIEEYNEWLEKGTVSALSELDGLKTKINASTLNYSAYTTAIEAFKNAKKTGGDLDYSEMTRVYENLEDKSGYTSTYNSIKSKIDGLEKEVEESYLNQEAASQYNTTKLAAEISGLKERVDALTKAMRSGDIQLKNYANVMNRVSAAIGHYNTVANSLYAQLVAETIPTGYGAEIYTDKYQDAMKQLNVVLGKIYEVKKVNDDAKKAYDAETDVDKKPEIPALPDSWASDDYESELQAVYDKVIEEVGDKANPAQGTLRAAYKALASEISALRTSLTIFNRAKGDSDTDKNGKVIGTYFTDKVTDIESKISDLEKEINEANKEHSVKDFDINANGKTTIDNLKTALVARLTEFNKYVSSRDAINTLETSKYKAEKKTVDGYKYKEYVAADRFSRAHIDKAIGDVKAEARKNYQVDEGDYTYGSNVKTAITTITKDIDTWKTSAQNAFNKYTEIYNDITEYGWEIEGREAQKDKDGNVTADEIKSWKSVVTNENVVIGGAATGKTYGQAKSEQDLIKATALNELTKAMAVDKAKEDDFVKQLDKAYDKHTTVEDAKNEIVRLKDSFSEDEPKWQVETNWKAAKDAVEESKRILGVYETNLGAITDYNADNCGTAAAKKLDEDKAKLGADITAIKKLIEDVEKLIPATSTGLNGEGKPFDKETSAKAIEQINEIRTKSSEVNTGIEKLNGNITSAKANFKEVSEALTEIGYQINGRAAAENVSEIKSITDLLSPSTVSFGTEIAELNKTCKDIKEELNAASVVADARKDTPATETTDLVKGLDTKVKELQAAVANIRTKAENEAKNQKNKNAWDAFLQNPQNKKPAVTAQTIIDEVIANIKKTNPAVAESAGENYFLNLINDPTKGQQTAYNKVLDDAQTAYETKLKDGKYTDPEKNLTDAKLAELKNKVNTVLDEIAKYPTLSQANEDAKAAQDKKWAEVNKKYNDIRVEISASKPSGDNFQTAYNNALDKLTTINNDLTAYGTDKDDEYAKGNSEGFDSKVQNLPKLTEIEKALDLLQASWENGENSYNNAVANDNQARYNAFLIAANKLKETYYGKTDGTGHTGGAIENVTKLSQLSYANQVDPTLVNELLEGDDGLYAYANKIEALIKEAQEEKDATKAPDFFDIEESFKDAAAKMEETIVDKRDTYAALVNEKAVDTYKAGISEVENSIADACKAVIDAGLAKNEDEAKKLLDEKKSLYLVGKGAITIYNEAVESYNNGKPEVLFAYRLDKEFLPGFDEVETLLNASKELAAQDDWTKKLTKVDTNADRKAMQDFYWSANWKSALLEDFKKGGALESYGYLGFEKLPTAVTFDEYADYVKAYNQYVQTRTIGKKEETHTYEYWVAYDSNEKYKELKAADEALTAEIARLKGLYTIAEIGIRDLVIEHDEYLVSNLESIKNDIEGLSTVKNNTIQTRIEGLNSSAIHKELQALNIEMNNMKKYLEANLQGKDSENWGKVDALQKENEKIYRLFDQGEGTPVVKTSAEDTYASYRKLEQEIGALKTSFDTNVANDKTEVDNAFDDLLKMQAEFNTLYEGMFQQTQEQYKAEYDAIAPQIEAIREKINAQGEAISIEKANNIKSIGKATQAIDDLTAELKAYNKDYEDNAQFVDEQNALLEQYMAKLNAVVAKELKNKKTNDDGKLYVDTESANIKSYKESFVDSYLESLESLVKNSNYDGCKKDAEYYVSKVGGYITDLEKTVLTYDVNTETTNVDNEITAVKAKIEEAIPSTAALYGQLMDKVTDQEDQKVDADTYKDHVLKAWWDGKWNAALGIVDHHDEVMEKYKTILDALEEIESSIKRPGAITNDGGEVIAEDLGEMVKLTLQNSWTEGQLTLADVDGNKAVDVADLVMVRNFFLYGKYDGLASSATTNNANKVAARTPQTAGTMALAVQQASLGVSLDSEINYSAVQMDVTLPAGLILTDAAFAGAGEVNAEFNKIGDHTWRVVVYAADGESVNMNADLVKLSMAGAGNGQIVINNVKGANARGMLISIKGVAGDYSGATGINATMAQAKAYFYGVDGTVRKGISKGITIVKEAGNKVKKVLTK